MVMGFCDFIFVDESGIHKPLVHERGWSKRGVKIHGTRPGRKFDRTNIIAGLFGKKHIAVKTYKNRTNSAFFEDWFEWELLAEVPEFSVIVMDNARFHRKLKLQKIADRYGVFLLFLPPYSPDFNPIEKSWANLKKWLRKNLKFFPSLDFAIYYYFGCF
jgi:transposase